MTSACGNCLRRAHLIARLAPRIAGALQGPRPPGTSLLALPDAQLIAAVLGHPEPGVLAWLEAFDAVAARAAVREADSWALCPHASGYPAGLGQLTDPPAVLFGRGRQEALEQLAETPAVTIVGTRRPSPYGSEMAHAFGRALGVAGVVVVSGLALGIDGDAHRGCVDADGLPIAVLAGGPDIPYPSRHRWLYEQVRSRGAILSEFPPGQRAFRWSFPARNRIMAGLAGTTIVVEAAEPSGSLITAEFARELGRTVGAVPGRVTNRMAAGSNRLLQDGAAVITGPEDVLDQIYGVGARPRPEPRLPDDEGLRAVLTAVEEVTDPAEIAARAGLDAAEARSALGRLEAEGWIARDALGGYERRVL
ncbi:MAG TPA: DNA-processing protein DprA [Thermoleophilaceae bacterium]